ncbi:MAG: DUF1573 domain-containing protein [Planctomycetales bacterium]|nr:DUF1573 domain-containing protein [Planctomycetales bacterium]
MLRRFLTAVFILSCASIAANAQDWANKMFTGERTHSFGTVARGAKEEHRFELKNLYVEDIHISGVRASCGCAIPSIEQETLRTHEKGAILVKFNTNSFVGQRSATITVTIDRPYFAEVQLNINGYIRGDVVFNPGTVNFGSIEQGAGAKQSVSVTYAGRSDWRIQDVRSANTNLQVELMETQRVNGRVTYQLGVGLKPDAPNGYFKDQMVLVTNDGSQQNIPIQVEGSVLSPVQVSPAALTLGVVDPGQTVTRNIVVKSKKPFRITSIKSDDNSFELAPVSDEEKLLHLVPVTFTANKAGRVTNAIKIETSLGNGSVETVMATATVREADIN